MSIEKSPIQDINAIARWLSSEQPAEDVQVNADLIVLAGHAVVPAVLGVMTLAAQTGLPLLLSGGIGHSTELLRSALAENPLTRNVRFDHGGEADMLFTLATQIFAIPASQLYVEPLSTNCGQNAAFTRDMIMEKGIPAGRILLSQDPLMQRRTRETFEFSWRQQHLAATFINWPVFVPQLAVFGDNVTITGAQSAGIWSVNRFISMLLGEMRRLNDDAQGYGPAGAGFIDRVDMPDSIRAAWVRVRAYEEFAGLSRA